MKNLIFFGFMLIFSSCNRPEEPIFKKLDNIQFNSVSFQQPYSVTFNADAHYFNPNAIGADITEMDFDIYVNDHLVTHIHQDITATMLAKSDFVLPIKCKVPLAKIFKEFSLTDLVKDNNIQYKMEGHLKLGIGGIEVKVPLNDERETTVNL